MNHCESLRSLCFGGTRWSPSLLRPGWLRRLSRGVPLGGARPDPRVLAVPQRPIPGATWRVCGWKLRNIEINITIEIKWGGKCQNCSLGPSLGSWTCWASKRHWDVGVRSTRALLALCRFSLFQLSPRLSSHYILIYSKHKRWYAICKPIASFKIEDGDITKADLKFKAATSENMGIKQTSKQPNKYTYQNLRM